MTHHIRIAEAIDTDTIVGILIASKEAPFSDTIDEHDRDVSFGTRRWREYIPSGSRAQQSLRDGWVFIAELDGAAVGFAAYPDAGTALITQFWWSCEPRNLQGCQEIDENSLAPDADGRTRS